MDTNYFMDMEKLRMDQFRNILKSKDFLPGRIVLKDKIDERFDLLGSFGIATLSDLLESLKTKPRLENFSKRSGLSTDYLTFLRREANSYLSVPLKLVNMPFVETDIIEKLSSAGIKDSKQLFDLAAKRSDREMFANRLKIPIDKLLELVQLCDLVRITGVGPVFARIIYDSGICTVKKFMSIDSADLLDILSKTNTDKGLTKVKFAKKDIEYCKELGKYLPLVLET